MGVQVQDGDRGGIASAVGRMADGLARLFTEHLALARMELSRDAKAVGIDVARVVAFVPLVLLGYGFLCAAAAVALTAWMSMAAALGVVGGVNLVGGGLGIWAAVSSLKSREMMNDTVMEVSKTAMVLKGDKANGQP